MLRKIFRFTALMASCLLLLVCATSYGEHNLPAMYLGGALGQVKAKAEKTDTLVNADSVDDTSVGGKIFLGYSFNQNFAAELNYFELGDVRYTSTTASADGKVKTRALAVSGVALLPIKDVVSLGAKLGVYTARVNSSAGLTFDANNDADSHAGLSYGLTARYQFLRSWALDLSWDELQAFGSDELKLDNRLLSLGIIFTYGQ